MSRRPRQIISFLYNHFYIIISIFFATYGILMGIFVRQSDQIYEYHKKIIIFPGELFNRALKFITLPLVFCNYVTGMCRIANKSRKITIIAFSFYFVTSILSTLIGLAITFIFSPEFSLNNTSTSNINASNLSSKGMKIEFTASTFISFLELLKNIFPDNLVEMFIRVYSVPTGNTMDNSEILNPMKRNSPNNLGILVFGLVLGHIIGGLGDGGKVVFNFFDCLAFAALQIVNMILKFAPIGAASILFATLLDVDDPMHVLKQLLSYIYSYLIAYAIIGIIYLPLIYYLFCRKNPLILFKNILEALVVAFTTASSLMTLTTTLKCIEQKCGVSKTISRSILFIGTSICFVASPFSRMIDLLFIINSENKDITLSDVIFVGAFITVLSLTECGVPSGGMLHLLLLLDWFGISSDKIRLLYLVEWLNDRFRTILNVLNNTVITCLVYELCIRDLDEEIADF